MHGYDFVLLHCYLTHSKSTAKDLITHLLCVDPAARYTIDEFLDHPWCKEAPAPPPPPTPLAVPHLHRAIDSPLLQSLRGSRELRSPGIHTLKEAFDITYAVHRAEEEGARRRAYNGPGGAGVRGFLHGLNEDDEEENESDKIVENARRRQDADRQAAVPNTSSAAYRTGARSNVRSNQPQHERLDEGRAGPRDRVHGGQKGFELDMNGATLLGRRHRKPGHAAAGGIVNSSPLSRHLEKGFDTVDAPQSPMHIG